MKCPVCGYDYTLMEGRFPPHTVNGDPCPGSKLDLDGAARVAALRKEVRDEPPAAAAETVPVLPTKAPARQAPQVAPVDTASKPQRKPRFDKGKRRPGGDPVPLQVRAQAAAEAARIQDAADKGVPAKPKAKRQRRGYIVVVGAARVFSTLAEASAALGEEIAAYNERQGGPMPLHGCRSCPEDQVRARHDDPRHRQDCALGQRAKETLMPYIIGRGRSGLTAGRAYCPYNGDAFTVYPTFQAASQAAEAEAQANPGLSIVIFQALEEVSIAPSPKVEHRDLRDPPPPKCDYGGCKADAMYRAFTLGSPLRACAVHRSSRYSWELITP